MPTCTPGVPPLLDLGLRILSSYISMDGWGGDFLSLKTHIA